MGRAIRKVIQKGKWLALLCLLLVSGAASSFYYDDWRQIDSENISVTAPFQPQYTNNHDPQSSIDLVAEICGITQFSQRYHTDGSGQRIALIDSGIDLSHEAFCTAESCNEAEQTSQQPKVVIYRDYTGEGDVVINTDRLSFNTDSLGHGTFLAGLMAGNCDHYRGLAPEAQLYIYKIFDQNGQSSQQRLAKAIRQAILDDVDCINLSLSIPKGEPICAELEEVLYQAKAANIPVIAAAGNYGPGRNTTAYPARAEYVIGIGSYIEPELYKQDRDLFVKEPFIADYSGRGRLNGGESPLLVAPAGVISAVPDQYGEAYLYDYGTSISAAITTAAVCHVQQAAEERGMLLSIEQLKMMLCNWSKDLGFSMAEQGHGALRLGELPHTAEMVWQSEGIGEETIVYNKNDKLLWPFVIPQGQSRSWFVEVPIGCREIAAIMQVDQQPPQNPWEHLIAMGRCYVSIYDPDGLLMDQSLYLGASYLDELQLSDKVGAILPKAGTWEVVVTSADDLSRYNHLESSGRLKIEIK